MFSFKPWFDCPHPVQTSRGGGGWGRGLFKEGIESPGWGQGLKMSSVPGNARVTVAMSLNESQAEAEGNWLQNDEGVLFSVPRTPTVCQGCNWSPSMALQPFFIYSFIQPALLWFWAGQLEGGESEAPKTKHPQLGKSKLGWEGKYLNRS